MSKINKKEEENINLYKVLIGAFESLSNVRELNGNEIIVLNSYIEKVLNYETAQREILYSIPWEDWMHRIMTEKDSNCWLMNMENFIEDVDSMLLILTMLNTKKFNYGLECNFINMKAAFSMFQSSSLYKNSCLNKALVKSEVFSDKSKAITKEDNELFERYNDLGLFDENEYRKALQKELYKKFLKTKDIKVYGEYLLNIIFYFYCDNFDYLPEKLMKQVGLYFDYPSTDIKELIELDF